MQFGGLGMLCPHGAGNSIEHVPALVAALAAEIAGGERAR